MHKKILITGASSGIGEALALSLAPLATELYLLARREERLIGLRERILSIYPRLHIHLLIKDVTDPDLLNYLEEKAPEIDILINNAGLALGRDKVEKSELSDWQKMFDVNVHSLFKITHFYLPQMLKKTWGDIVNIASIAGIVTYPGGSVYCATKHAVRAFTKVLREEVAGKNVRIMMISPGMVETEFSLVRFKGNEVEADKVYEGMTPLLPEDIARMIHFMLIQPRHVVIDEIVTMPTDQGSATTVHRAKNENP